MLQQKFVAFAGVAREQDELARVVTERNLVLRLLRLYILRRNGMASRVTIRISKGVLRFVRKRQTVVNHVVGFLLVTRFVHWNQCKVTVEAAVLFVL